MIRNVPWAANQHIRMISEGSCDTEDWSNEAGNSALITGINYILNIKHFKYENIKQLLKNYLYYKTTICISQYLYFYSILSN